MYIVPNEVMNIYREKLDNIRLSKSLLADRSERHKENAAEGCSYKAGEF